VIFQGFAIAPESAKKPEKPQKCADFHCGNKSDSKKSGFIRLIENKDIAQQFAITFFRNKAFYCDKKSSLFFVGNRALPLC
jgi:hypothetical protein